MLPIVAIIGRANVGKSTLFNRLVGKREAITADWAGTTRDRLYGECVWNGKTFMLVDTAGLELNKTDSFDLEIQEQINIAIDEAELLLLIVDTKTGITKKDLDTVKRIRLSKKPFIVVANKCDNLKEECLIDEFYQLGAKLVMPVSALSGRGSGDLLDVIVKNLPLKQNRKQTKENFNENEIVVAIAGRPNVGKSSLLNQLIGQERAVVSEKAGTTRDSADFTITRGQKKIIFIDTAGIRRRGRIGKSGEGKKPGQIEKYSVLRSLRAIDRSSVVLLLIDAVEGITSQDLHIIGFALEKKKSIVLVVNKWDAVDDGNMQEYLSRISQKVPFLPFAPIIFISAKTGKNVHKVYDLITGTHEGRFRRVPTGELNSAIAEDILKKSPPPQKNILPKIKYVTQTDVNPPTFVFFTNHPELIHFSYVRYLENKIREHWGFNGTPIKILFRKKK